MPRNPELEAILQARFFDDVYGVWTEADQTSAAAEAFQMLDREKEGHDSTEAR